MARPPVPRDTLTKRGTGCPWDQRRSGSPARGLIGAERTDGEDFFWSRAPQRPYWSPVTEGQKANATGGSGPQGLSRLWAIFTPRAELEHHWGGVARWREATPHLVHPPPEASIHFFCLTRLSRHYLPPVADYGERGKSVVRSLLTVQKG